MEVRTGRDLFITSPPSPGRHVRLPNLGLLRGEWLLPALPHVLRVHLDLLVLRSRTLLRRNQGHDWILPNGLVEVLLGDHDPCHLYRRLPLQHDPVDSDQVPVLRVSLVVARLWLVHRSLVHVVHPWVHDLVVVQDPRRLQDGKKGILDCELFFKNLFSLQKMRLIVRIDDDIATLRKRMQEEQRLKDQEHELNSM